MSRKRRRDDLGPDGPHVLDARETSERLAALPSSSAPGPAALRKTVPFPAVKKVRLVTAGASTSSAPSTSSATANVVSPPWLSPQRSTKPSSSNLKARDDQTTPTPAANNSPSFTAAPNSSASPLAFSPFPSTTTAIAANANAVNASTTSTNGTIVSASASSSAANRCHICYRKPTKKADLDSFADCQGCGQRTCFVCIRECMGWMPGLHDDGGSALMSDRISHADDHHNNAEADETADSSFTMQDVGGGGEGEEEAAEEEGSGGNRQRARGETPNGRHDARGHKGMDGNQWVEGGHRQMVCSRCCIERGSDGDVVCLGCLPFVEG